MTFITGGSGGLGKSSTARALAHALGQAGYRTVLVDGNPGQQSQRVFLRLDDAHGLEYATLADLKRTLVMPDRTHAAFAFLPGPGPAAGPDITGLYGNALIALRSAADMIVVDADRVDPTLWDDRTVFAGGVMRPFVEHGNARIIFRIGQSGSQLDDGLAALDAIRRPDQVLAVGVAGPTVRARSPREWSRMVEGLAVFAGVDHWDRDSAALVEAGRPGWARGREPEWLRSCMLFAGAGRDRLVSGRRIWPWTR